MTEPVAAVLTGGRLHLQHGPIDLIVSADPIAARKVAYRAAVDRFHTVLNELAAELPLLRTVVRPDDALPKGAIACRMDNAVRPYCSQFVTRMAAVAGAVADTILQAMTHVTALDRAYVNNGGDIAIHLGPDQFFRTAIKDHRGRDLGIIHVLHGHGIGGIASSGRHGRSFSLGIADNVTVLADCAAKADAAATLIANAVDLPGHPAVRRVPATRLDPDCDLQDRHVTQAVGRLNDTEVQAALNNGAHRARRIKDRGLLVAAAMHLQGQSCDIGAGFALPAPDRPLMAV